MLEKKKKPFYFKKKLLYQTKVNFWGVNESRLSLRLKKKKWNFLRFFAREKKSMLTFKFSPFSRAFGKRFNRYNFKNNMYVRKIIRLKYGRLKNKELYKLFKKSYNYKKFIEFLGSRLDIFLHRILKKKKSVFNIRQLLSHKGVLVNGRLVQSPNFALKKFDVISLKLNVFSEYYFLYQTPYEHALYLDYMLFNLVKSVAFDSLSEKGRLEFLKEFSKKVCPNHFNEAFNFVKKQAPLYYKFANIKFLRENKKNICFNKNFKKYLSIDDFIILVQKRFLKHQIFFELFFLKHAFYFEDFYKDNENIDIGFFDSRRLGLENFEFNFYKNHLDIVFLGVLEKDKDIVSFDKYLLHYLYH